MIRPLLSRLGFFVQRAGSNMTSERIATLLTLTVVVISFLIFGAYVTVGVNVAGFVNDFAGKAQIVFYLRDGADSPSIHAMMNALRALPGVGDVDYVSKPEALERLKRDLVDAPDFLATLTDSPVPASVEVTMSADYRNRSDPAPVLALGNPAIVESADAGDEFSRAFAGLLSGMWLAGSVIAVFLMLSAIFIVANTIRLAIIRRREEIETMRLVGATNNFVKAPFLIEGVIVGAAGAAGAAGALYVAYREILVPWVIRGPALSVLTTFEPRFLSPATVLFGIALGAFIGLVGAQLSVGRYLKI